MSELPGKPFDLEAAKRGEPMIAVVGAVVGKDLEVPIKEWHRFESMGKQCKNCAILASHYQDAVWWFNDSGVTTTGLSVRMAPQKRTVWFRVLALSLMPLHVEAQVYDCESDARKPLVNSSWRVLDIFSHEITE